jgi:hypothetical protein
MVVIVSQRHEDISIPRSAPNTFSFTGSQAKGKRDEFSYAKKPERGPSHLEIHPRLQYPRDALKEVYQWHSNVLAESQGMSA